jgi:hypothetical protein
VIQFFELRGPGTVRALAAGLLPCIVATAFSAPASRILIADDFESYTNTASLRAVWTNGTGELLTNAPGGGQAVLHDGDDTNRKGGFSITPDETHTIVLSADFYDFATNIDKRVTLSLRNAAGQSLDIGIAGSAIYSVRAVGYAAHTNWVPFKRGQQAIAGWHRMRAELSQSNLFATLDSGVNGKVDRKLNIPLDGPVPKFSQLRFGGLSKRPSRGGPVLVDNIRLEVVTVSPPVGAAPVVAEKPTSPEPAASLATSTAAAPTPTVSKLSVEAPLPVSPAPPPVVTNITPPVQPTTLSAAPPAASPTVTEASTVAAAWWICGALGVIIVLLAGLMLMLKRQGPTTSTALVRASSGVTMPAAPGVGDEWQKRALNAEALAAKQAKILGEKVGPELVEFAKETLVQGLYTQRNALIETQRRAQQALVDLEARLGELHLPVAERIDAYEKRIAELEKELETRGDEMRELTRATLLLVREKLEQEKAREQRRFN